MNSTLNSVYVRLANHWADIRDLDRERGLTTTEIAVLTFILVALAVTVGGILWSYATNQANSLPDNPTETFTIGDGTTTTTGG